VANWMRTAAALDAQGETVLAGEVRQFVNRLPAVLTDKEWILFSMLNNIIYPGRQIIRLFRQRTAETRHRGGPRADVCMGYGGIIRGR
jgi:hypothetical protein